MRAVDSRIDVHQIRRDDFRRRSADRTLPCFKPKLSLRYAISDPRAEVLTKCGSFLLLETTVTTYPIAMISGKQIRAARALLGWKQRELAAAASVSEVSFKIA